jgi:hypothetical protein
MRESGKLYGREDLQEILCMVNAWFTDCQFPNFNFGLGSWGGPS